MKKHKRIKVKNSDTNIKVSHKWTALVTVLAFVFTVLISMLTAGAEKIGMAGAFGMLMAIVLLGVLFDILGVSVSTATETPFNAMAAQKIRGAKESISIIRKAQQISSLCNDVVGDIAGIVSGAMTAVVTAALAVYLGVSESRLELLLAGIVAALMIGGKAAGKGFAMTHNNSIVFMIGRLCAFFKRILHFKKSANRG